MKINAVVANQKKIRFQHQHIELQEQQNAEHSFGNVSTDKCNGLHETRITMSTNKFLDSKSFYNGCLLP